MNNLTDSTKLTVLSALRPDRTLRTPFVHRPRCLCGKQHSERADRRNIVLAQTIPPPWFLSPFPFVAFFRPFRPLFGHKFSSSQPFTVLSLPSSSSSFGNLFLLLLSSLALRGAPVSWKGENEIKISLNVKIIV